MPALTAAQVIATIANMTDAEHEAMRAALRKRDTVKAVQAAAGSPADGAAFASREARAAGAGWPCTAVPACGRSNLRTEARASRHGNVSATDGTGGHNPAWDATHPAPSA